MPAATDSTRDTTASSVVSLIQRRLIIISVCCDGKRNERPQTVRYDLKVFAAWEPKLTKDCNIISVFCVENETDERQTVTYRL